MACSFYVGGFAPKKPTPNQLLPYCKRISANVKHPSVSYTYAFYSTKKPLTLSEKNKRLIGCRYVILHLLYRGAHHFEQKFVQAAGVPVFPEHGVAQVVEALDDNAVFRRGKKYL